MNTGRYYHIKYIINGSTYSNYILVNIKSNIIDSYIKFIKMNHKIQNIRKILGCLLNITDVGCVGCLYDSPGQLNHMGPGGCLTKFQ